MPGARCTRGLVCSLRLKRNAHEHTGEAEAVRHPLREWLYGLYRALLGETCSVAPVTCAMRNIVASLTPASGRRDHATSPYANCNARRALPSRPPHPASRSVPIGLTPLMPRRDGANQTPDLTF